MSKAVKGVKKVVKSVTQPITSTLEGVWHVGEAGVNLLGGNVSKASENLAKATGDITKATVGAATFGTAGVIAPKLLDTSKQAGEMVGNYALMNFNRGSQNLENITGWDVDNSIAEDAERAAQAKYQAEVEAANAAADRNRRANLLSLRKSLTPSLSKTSQGGLAGANTDIKSAGGIILG